MFKIKQATRRLVRGVLAPLSAVVGFGLVAIAFLSSLQNSLAAGG